MVIVKAAPQVGRRHDEQLTGSDGGRFVFVDPKTGEERQLTLA